jgi:hypothetical protein
MALSCFDDKTCPPTEAELTRVLGKAASVWTDLVKRVESGHAPLAREWAFPGKAYGWSFRLRQPRRVFLYLTPGRGHFVAAVVLGEKAASAALADPDLPEAVKTDLAAARVYAEGRGIRLTVRCGKDTMPVEILLGHKGRT